MTGVIAAQADDDVNDVSAKPAAVPEEVTGPSSQGIGDALGTMRETIPEGSRMGVLTLSNGVKIEGRVWTTLETPLRLWIDEIKAYRDVDLALIKRIEVKVLSEKMEDDWRWLKEGSDQKVFSGKKYPNVELAYTLTLLNGQVLEGTVVAPIYTFDGQKRRNLALYKKYHGKLDETLADVVYIKTIELAPAAAATQANESTTRKLPLIY